MLIILNSLLDSNVNSTLIFLFPQMKSSLTTHLRKIRIITLNQCQYLQIVAKIKPSYLTKKNCLINIS